MKQIPITTPQQACAIFPASVKEISDAMARAEQAARLQLDAIAAIPAAERNFDNTCRALDVASGLYNQTANVIEILSMVSPDQEVRDAAQAGAVALAAKAVDLFMDQRLYVAFREYEQNGLARESLAPAEQYYFDEAMTEFKRVGLHLPADQQVRIKELQKEISALGVEFEANIAKDQSTITVGRDELLGVDGDFLAALKRDGEGYVLGCDYPTVNEVLQHCSVESTRKNLQQAFNNRAYPVNEPILHRIMKLRQELAQLLGYGDFASYSIANSMAKTSARAKSFVEDLLPKVQLKFRRELATLIADLPEGVSLDEKGRMKPWDYAYVLSYHKKKYFDVDERVVAEYFPVDKALRGMLDIYQTFLGLTFTEVKPDRVWHEEVRMLEVRRQSNGALLGYVLLDLYPRDNKFSHACCGGLVQAQKGINGEPDKPAVVIVIANFPRANAGKPALFKHRDVETFFHEFGHAMHQCLGQTELASQSGTHVKRDFVELPSQIFEEWMNDKAMLQQISSHYATGEPLPEKLIDNKIALKKFDSGYFVTRQLIFSLLSLEIHEAAFDGDSAALAKKIRNRCMPEITSDLPNNFCCSFGHLVGYDAKYYGYMWSKVFAIDCFSRVKRAGLLNETIGKRYGDIILGSGGSKDPNELLVEFLGRGPSQEAFLEDIGV